MAALGGAKTRRAGAILVRARSSRSPHEPTARARRIATSGASSEGAGAIAVAPRSSQTPAGIANAERPATHSARTRLAKRAARNSIGTVLWIGPGGLRKRRASETEFAAALREERSGEGRAGKASSRPAPHGNQRHHFRSAGRRKRPRLSRTDPIESAVRIMRTESNLHSSDAAVEA